MDGDKDDLVRQRAYEIWESEGRQDGQHDDHWNRAERETRAKYPGILLNIVEGMSGHLGHMLRLGQLDLAILFNSDIASDLTATPLLDEELFVLLPDASPLVPAGRTSLTVEEAAALPLILPTGAHGLRRRVAAEFEERNLTAQVVACGVVVAVSGSRPFFLR